MADVLLPWTHERVRQNISQALGIPTAGFIALPIKALAWKAAALALSLGLAWRMRSGPRV